MITRFLGRYKLLILRERNLIDYEESTIVGIAAMMLIAENVSLLLQEFLLAIHIKI